MSISVSGGRIYVTGGYVGVKDHDELGLVPHRLDTVESLDPVEVSPRGTGDTARESVHRSVSF